jgi:PTH1 family peptidyl-tRNA hydrolase
MVVGLGNPGLQYKFSRHNIGFRIIDNLAREMETEFKKVKSYDSLVSRGKLMNHKLILVKPQTYMNLSGKSASKIVSYYRISFQDLLIVYDDLNLELGQIRIRKRGSAGGHKGVESIIQYLNSKDIPRLRIGIGKPSINSNFDYASYVLSNFKDNEKDKISEVIQLSTEAIKTVIEDGLVKAMRKYNRKLEVS